MKALFYILNNADLLPQLLKELNSAGIKGCTIFDAEGMARELSKSDEFSSMFGGLRFLLKPNTKGTKALLMIINEERIQIVVETIEKITGNLELPETGILFTIPLDFIKGVKL